MRRALRAIHRFTAPGDLERLRQAHGANGSTSSPEPTIPPAGGARHHCWTAAPVPSGSRFIGNGLGSRPPQQANPWAAAPAHESGCPSCVAAHNFPVVHPCRGRPVSRRGPRRRDSPGPGGRATPGSGVRARAGEADPLAVDHVEMSGVTIPAMSGCRWTSWARPRSRTTRRSTLRADPGRRRSRKPSRPTRTVPRDQLVQRARKAARSISTPRRYTAAICRVCMMSSSGSASSGHRPRHGCHPSCCVFRGLHINRRPRRSGVRAIRRPRRSGARSGPADVLVPGLGGGIGAATAGWLRRAAPALARRGAANCPRATLATRRGTSTSSRAAACRAEAARRRPPAAAPAPPASAACGCVRPRRDRAWPGPSRG